VVLGIKRFRNPASWRWDHVLEIERGQMSNYGLWMLVNEKSSLGVFGPL